MCEDFIEIPHGTAVSWADHTYALDILRTDLQLVSFALYVFVQDQLSATECLSVQIEFSM